MIPATAGSAQTCSSSPIASSVRSGAIFTSTGTGRPSRSGDASTPASAVSAPSSSVERAAVLQRPQPGVFGDDTLTAM